MTLQRRFRLMRVVLRKELMDASRDRRAILTILFSAMFGPVLVGFMLNRLADRQRDVEEVRIPVVGAEHAPALVDWLKQQAGVQIVPGPLDPEAAVRDRGEDVVVVISPEFAKKFRSALPAQVKIVSDGSRTASRPKVQRVRGLFARYSAEIGSLRLVARGITPAIATPVHVEDVEVSSAQQRAASILNFIPLFIVLAAFTSGMQIATDSTAGERERGSLEPLLVNPAPRSAIVGGKWLAATIASMIGVVLTTLLCLVMLNFIPLQELGIRFRLGVPEIAGMLAAVLPMCMLATGVQTYLSTFARSFKEAQSYMGFLMMVPILPGMMATLSPMTNKPWMYPIPILGQHVLLADVIGGRSPAVMWFLIAAGGALAGAALLVGLTRALFERERIIFSR
jgi:sodium transport system permease protein